MTTDIPHYAIYALRSHNAKQLVIDLCIDPKGPKLPFKKAAKQVGVSENHIKRWVHFHQKTGFLGYIGQRQAALLCIYKKNPAIKISEVVRLMKNMGFHCTTKIIKQHLKYLKTTLTSTYFISGDEDAILEDIRKLTLFRKYKKKGTVDADRLTYDVSIIDHTYADVPDSVSESSDEESSETYEEKLTNHNINRIIKNNRNINKILNTPETYQKRRKNKKLRNTERRHFKISLIREQVTHLCIDDRGPKISSASAAKYLKCSEMLIDKWISQAIRIKEFILQKKKYRHCSKIYEVAGRLFILNPNLTQLQTRFIMDHVKVYVSSTRLQQILPNLEHLLNTSEFSEENEFDKITLDNEDLDYCINTLKSLIGWSNKNSKKVLENLKEDGDHLTFQKIVSLSSLKHLCNYNYSENSPEHNLDSQTNEIYFSPSCIEIEGKSSSLCSNINEMNNTKDLIMSNSSILSDKTNVKNVKTGTASITEVCKKIQTYGIQPLHVKLAVVKEQVIYLHLNQHGPKMDLSTIASHLNQSKTILKTWINQASYVKHTVQRLHVQHTCGFIQEAIIRVFKMNPALSEAETVYVLNYIKITVTRYRLERYLEQTQYILDGFEWPAEILSEAESIEISLDEKELNYCNNVIYSLLNSNEFEKYKALQSISANLNCTPSDRLRLNSNEFSIDINDEPIACVPKEEIITDSEYIGIIKETININEKKDVFNSVPDSTENKQIQNEELVKDNTKINQADIVNFRIKEESSNQQSYNETVIPERITQLEEMFTSVKYTNDLIISVSSGLSDKTKDKNIKSGAVSGWENVHTPNSAETLQKSVGITLHVKFAVVKEQVIYLHLNPHGPKMDLSTIASHLNQPKTILETWINQASYIQYTVQRLHVQHTCGFIQEAIIRVFKMNPALSEAEAVNVLNHTKIYLTKYKLERYIDQTQYIFDRFEWPAEIVPEVESLNKIPLDEKELNYCNGILFSLLDRVSNHNEYEKGINNKESCSISANVNSKPSDGLRLNSNEFSIDIKDESIDCISNQEIVTDLEYLDTINEEININEKIDVFNPVPDSNENKQIQNEELVKDTTKINQVDIVNFRKVELPNQKSYNETIIPESIIKVEEMSTHDNELDMIDGSSRKKEINYFIKNCQLSNNHVRKQNKTSDVFEIKTIDSNKNTEKTEKNENNMYNLQADIEIIEEKIKSSTHHDREDINSTIKSKLRDNIEEQIFSQNALLVSADYKRKKRKLSDNKDETVTGIIMTEIIENEGEDCITIKYY